MRFTASKLYQKVTNFTLALVLAISSLMVAAPFILSQQASAVATVGYSAQSLDLADWVVDRTDPTGGKSIETFAGRTAIKLGVNASLASSDPFYKYEGIKRTIGQQDSIKADLYLDSDWLTKDVSAGIWAVGRDAGDVISAYPIVAFTKSANAWRIWDSTTGTWLTSTVGYNVDAWNTLELTLNHLDNTKIDVYINDQFAGQSTSDPTEHFNEVILNNYNYGTTPYDVRWSNIQSGNYNANTAPTVSFTSPTPTTGAYVADTITGSITATDDYGMGATYLRFWKDSFESGLSNLLVNCQNVPGAFNLGTVTTPTCVFDTTSVANGTTIVLSAQVLDGHGVYGNLLTRTYIVDNGTPTLSINNPTSGDLLPSTFALSGTADDAVSGVADVTYRVREYTAGIGSSLASGNVVPWTAISYDSVTKAWDTSLTLPTGDYRIIVHVTDEAGNGRTKRVDVSVDAQAPDVSLVSPAHGAVEKGASLTQSWTSTSTDVVKYVYQSYHDEAMTSLRWEEEFSPTVTSKTATNVADTTFWWQVTAIDAVGNQTTSPLWKLVVDNTAPEVSIDSPTGDLFNNDVEVRGTATDANLRHYWVQVKRDGVVVYSNTTLSTGISSELLYTATLDGDYVVTFAARDTAGGGSSTGNRSADVVKTFTIDKTAPTVAVLATTPVGGTTSVSVINATFDTDVVSYDLYLDGILVLDDEIAPFAEYVWDVSALASGSYNVRVEATDAAGNMGAGETAVEVDNTAPAAAITTSGTQNTATPTIDGTVDADATELELTIDGVQQTLTWTPGETTWTFTTDTLSEGSHTIAILARDAVGNEGGQSGTITVDLPEPAAVDNPDTETDETQPQAIVTPGEVLGETDDNTDVIAQNQQATDSDTEGSADVAGESDEQENTDTTTNIFGLAWYWWLLILAALIAAGWWIIGAVRKRNADNN